MMEVKRLLGLATQWLLARVLRYDLMLLTIVMCLITVGFITLFSAGYSFPWRIEDQMRNIIVALTAMFIVSFVPIRWVRKVSVAAFAAIGNGTCRCHCQRGDEMAGYWCSYSTLRDHETCCPYDACVVLLETC